jgi:hypothetical protein
LDPQDRKEKRECLGRKVPEGLKGKLDQKETEACKGTGAVQGKLQPQGRV